MSEGVGRWVIPNSWQWIRAEEIADVTGGGTPSTRDSSNFKSSGDGIPWLTPADLSKYDATYIERGSRDISEKGLTSSSAKLMPKGTVLFTSRAPIGYCVIAVNEISTNQGFKSLSLYQNISPELIRFYLLTSKIYAESFASGSTFKELSGKKVAQLKIPLPPLNEQKRIVTKIEALQTRSTAVKEELEAIKPLLNQFRQSVLASAFRGDLTKDWRSQNPDVEPASKLIASLQTPDPEHHLDIFEQSCYCKLPKSWTWVQLGKLGALLGGGTPSKRNPGFWSGHIPWISAKDMKIDRIKDSIDHITEEAISKSSAKIIPKSSILFVVRGMILNHTLPIAITDNVVTINQDMKALVPEIAGMSEYLLFACKFVSKQILFKVKSATHGTRRLETATLKDWAIPIPPISEQKEIVRRIESLFKLADNIEQQYQQAEIDLETLNQSILAKAFRGELVPQDPNDEPASVLLEKIKAERDKQKATAKKSKSKKKTNTDRVKQLGLDL